jgi:ketosteroid isomerase-like protein
MLDRSRLLRNLDVTERPYAADDGNATGSSHLRVGRQVLARRLTTKGTSSFADARARVGIALAAMGSGDPEPYIDCWLRSDDVTLFGAWGPIEKGRTRLSETFRWVGSRFKAGALIPEDVVSFESGDLAYTVGFERGEVVVDGGRPTPMTIRVTHVYRRIDGEWALVHRHADFPPGERPQPSLSAPR